MALLAVESSDRQPSLYWHDGQQGYDIVLSEGQQSSDLVSLLDGFLKEKNFKLDELEMLLVSKGPGNYTGLRMGLAFVQGLALTRSLKIQSFCSLESIIENWRLSNNIMDKELAVFVDARGGEVIGCRFTIKEGKIFKKEDILHGPAEDVLSGWPKNLLLLGSASESDEDARPQASALFSLYEQSRGEAVEATSLSPFYIRSPV
jgi:tRNA threonylcarbamoyl adenosine modification protein YeaZ